ncbi:MAG: hypothetical protein IT423_17430 [Pirellulaceae bacterium]|nr:hypothetical protein [Pirellulaceae bacterium]
MMVVLFPCGGATCSPRPKFNEFTPPIVFQQKPTLEQLIAQLNRTQNIERLSSGTVELSTPGAPMSLDGNLSWHRPYDFRLQAYPAATRMLGDALDAGSNSDRFWLLTKLPGEPATLYHASHQQFETQTGPRHILPVSPLWIREALGVIEFDPSWHHEGPIERPADGLVEIRSLIPTARGSYKRIVIVEPTRATVQQLILKDPDGKMVASAQMSEHQYKQAIDASLPHKVDMLLQPNGDSAALETGSNSAAQVMGFTIKIGTYLINEQSGNEQQRYAMPESAGFRAIDLVEANARMSAPPALTPPPPRTANTYDPMQNYR